MNITWLGQSCFKFEEKIGSNTVTVITDPYNNSIGLKMSKIKADLVSVSHDHEDHNNISAIESADENDLVIIDRPGEYEVKGVFVYGIGAYHDKKQGSERGKTNMFLFEIAGINILHLGDLAVPLSDKQLEKIGEVDILLIPVGGKETLNAQEAVDVVSQIEPRIVIPMHYKIPGLELDIETVDKFKSLMGGKAEVLPKYKIAKKDLPPEDIQLIILEKS